MGRQIKPVRVRFNPQRLRRTCETQKVCFDTREEALDAAEDQMREGRVSPGCHLTPYLCNECNRHHIWNSPIVPVPGTRWRGPRESKR